MDQQSGGLASGAIVGLYFEFYRANRVGGGHYTKLDLTG